LENCLTAFFQLKQESSVSISQTKLRPVLQS